MPTTKRCSFCGDRIAPGRGIMFIKRDGTIFYFCSSKCERNMKLGRSPRDVRWTERYRKTKEIQRT